MSASTAASDPAAARIRRLCAGGVGLALLAAPAAWSQPFAAGAIVEEVRAEWADGGAEPVPGEVLRLISVRPGDPYRPLAVRQSVKQLFALGRFHDIRVRAEPGEGDGVRLRFDLHPRARLMGVVVRGVPLRQRAGFAGLVTFPPGSAPPEPVVIEDRTEAWLADRGYLAASVSVEPVPQGRDLRLEVNVTAGPRARIQSFEAVGVEDALEAELRRILRASPGQVWAEAEILDRLPDVERRMRERGHLAASAQLDFEPLDLEGVHVILQVAAGPVFRLEVVGSALPDRATQDVLEAMEETGWSADALESARAELLVRSRQEGHPHAAVEIRESGDPDGSTVTIRFEATPGPRYVVGDVSTPGVPAALAEAAADIVAPFRSGRPFREAEWDTAARGLERLLLASGYPQAEVRAGWAPDPGDRRLAALTLEVESGPQVTIASVRFEGGAPYSDEELRDIAGLAAGAPYSAESVVGARENLESFYRDRGFLEATVTVEAPLEPPAGTDVRFRIRPGELHTVGEIIVAGLEITRESVVRNRLPVGPGDSLGRDDLLEIRRRLAAMGTFSSVEVDLLEPEEAVSDHNLLIRVVEGPRTSLGYGAGYSEREQVRGELEWSRTNLFGRDHSGSLFGRVSFRGSRLVATYRGADSPEGGGPVFLTAFREAQDRDSLDFVRSGVSLQVTRRVFGRDLFLRYDFTSSELFDVKIAPNRIDRNYADNLWLSKVSAAVVTDTRDDPVDPRTGRFGILDLEWSAGILGSRAPYVKSLVQQFAYVPIGGPVVLAAGVRVGAAVTRGADEPALLPLTERFFAGGATTHRGFRLDLAGPVDSGGYPLGGNLLLLGNLELRFPLFGDLRAALFSDHGGVHEEIGSFRVEDLRHAVGAGLRYDTPLGPIRFDYGIRLGDVGGDRRGQWHFTIGHAF